MLTLSVRVTGDECRGYVAQNVDDLAAFRAWVTARVTTGDRVAVDTETTGLDPYMPGFRVRLVQFGTAREGWLIPVEYGPVFASEVRAALDTLPRLAAHNYPFDVLALDRCRLLHSVEAFARKVIDTKILAHLVDSRPESEGGTGTHLKGLAARYVDPAADDGQRELVRVFREMGHDTKTGWAAIDVEHPVYLRYALLDVVLCSRLLPCLQDECRRLGIRSALADYEHHIAYIGAMVQRNGMPVDIAYTRRLRDDLIAERDHYRAIARHYGVTSVDASRQVAAALAGMGEQLTERTSSGELSVNKDVLLPLADLDRDWHRIGARDPNPLADAVLRAKRAGKWATTYADAILTRVDTGGRIHPTINTMGARTARWSVSNPPLQQLPSSDWRVRRCIVAPPGEVVVACDFSQVELRVLVALAGARDIIERVNRGEDLHTLTTRLVYGIGPEVSDAELKHDPRRKLCKTISLGKAYAGGVTTLARQTGLPVAQVKRAVAQYDRALPAIRRYGTWLTNQALHNGMTVRTPSGRLLRLDRDRTYTAIAYMCQSSARDVLGEALIEVHRAGLLPRVIGVVHDEVIMTAPTGTADEIAHELGRCMSMNFLGVKIESEPEIYGQSWGHGYGATS